MTFHDASRLAPLAALTLVLAGCVFSVDGVISESDAVYNPQLLGTWMEVGGSDRAVVSRASDHTYAIEYTSGGKTGRFEARLGSLGGRTVLDVWPTPGDGEVPEPYAGSMVAGHLLLALDIGPDEIQVAALEPDSILTLLRSGRMQLAHTRSGDQLVLHGTTSELRTALASHLDYPGILIDPGVWRRTADDSRPAPVAVPCFEASPWREADQLFRRDPHWVGADGASSVVLGDGRILWLFGDTWIDPTGRRTRDGAQMISNSVAIQSGTDPSTGSIEFYWNRAADGSPAPFIPDEADVRSWFGNGVRVGDHLLLFLGRIRGADTGLGFESVDWAAWIVENPDTEPSAWRMAQIETSTNPLGVSIGFAAVLLLDEYVYAFGSQDPVKSHPLFAVRWPVTRASQGDLSNPQWWAGERLGWVPDSATVPRHPFFNHGSSELTIHVDDVTQRFLAVQTQGFGPADVVMRAAPMLTGPWSERRLVYRPSEYFRPDVMIYAAKAHPGLTGADLVLTYNNNTFQFGEHLSDPLIYYPRFVRLTRCM